MQYFEKSLHKAVLRSVNYVYSIFQKTFQRINLYCCFAVLNSENLNILDSHETADFIGVMLQLILYFSNVNVLSISKVGIHFYMHY